jgi:hypothetical protein
MPKHPPELVQAIIEALAACESPYAAWKALKGQGHKVGRRTVATYSQTKAAEIERLREAIPKEVRDRVAAKYEQVAEETTALTLNLTRETQRQLAEGLIKDPATALYRAGGAMAQAHRARKDTPTDKTAPRRHADEVYRDLDGIQSGLGQAIKALIAPWASESQAALEKYLSGGKTKPTPPTRHERQGHGEEAKRREPPNEPLERQDPPRRTGDTHLLRHEDEPFADPNGHPFGEGHP